MNYLNLRSLAVSCLIFLSASVTLHAQDTQVIKKNGLTLTFINQDKSFSPELKKKMITTFFKVYPALQKQFNEKAARSVTFVIDTTYKGVAATQAGRVSFSPVWFRQHPEDLDVVTHEIMHIVQDYGQTDAPWWITEGIADYVRYKYGVANAAAKWTLPNYKSGQKYDNGYRVTARFFVWLEKNGYPEIIKNLDQDMRDHTYQDGFWKGQTEKTLKELWADYALNPEL